MSDPNLEIGNIIWTDLTVPDAEAIRDFYGAVVGWQPEPVEMGDYSDFNMNAPASGKAIAGICHVRGENADLPSQWQVYIVVANVSESAARCVELGGKVIARPRALGDAQFCVIQDPAGAVAALIEPTTRI